MRKSYQMQDLEEKHGKPIRQIVLDALNERGRVDWAAESLGITTVTLWRWTKQLRIEMKRIAQVA